MTRVYKIIDARVWEVARRDGVFRGSEIDLRDGYIHLSTAHQASQTARLHFAGRHGLALIAFEAQALGSELKWEAARGGELFPHLYGPLDPALAAETMALPLNAQGWPDPGDLVA